MSAAAAAAAQTALVIMAKAPEPGLAKTRLIPALGADGAARLAERMLRHTVSAARAAGFAHVELCVAPDTAHPLVQALTQQHGVALAPQGEGDLGQRMQRALQRALARQPRALVVGTDAPALDAAALQTAATALQDPDAVIVPAHDGGYALLGLHRRAGGPQQPAPALFEAMAWSTPQVLADTRERLRAAGLRWAELPAVADIDVPDDLRHLPPGWLDGAIDGAIDGVRGDSAPGRSCPLHYRYAPEVFRAPAPPALQGLEVLYVVGGLYGNPFALERVLQLFAQERGRKRLVFNGDFHWFDAEPALFAQVQRVVLEHTALRGNVETELAAPAGADDAGCGCAYPDWVGDGVVERSNRILARLREVTTAAQRAELAALPMTLRAEVGPLQLGIVHGDAQSLAGWGFAAEHLAEAPHRNTARGWLAHAGVDAFACSHTCLPVFQPLHRPGHAEPGWVWNNGAAGMPNFSGDSAGLLTRVALAPLASVSTAAAGLSRLHVRAGAVHVDALALEIDPTAWQARFRSLWPAGSDADRSYFERIVRGPAWRPAQALPPPG
jgi:rSAM/selenodomain-associated transferase 1